jgi:hypothetical protein
MNRNLINRKGRVGMKSTFLENESKEFKEIILSSGLGKVATYMSITDLDREIKKSYLKGKINSTNYKNWADWDEDTRMVALRRYVFYSRRAQ